MGGRSEATINWDKQGAMVWSGYLSLENNEASSIRSSGSTFDWSDYQGVEVILEGNGRDVQVSAQRLDRMIRAGGYRALVPTVLQGETRIYIPFTAFELKDLSHPGPSRKAWARSGKSACCWPTARALRSAKSIPW